MELDAAFVQCAEIVRELDPDRYLTALMAEPDKRGPLMALYAFTNEVAKSRDTAHEPHLALIRLQWWRDVLADFETGTLSNNPILVGLRAVLATSDLRMRDLVQIIDAYEADLDDPLIQTWDDLDKFCDTTAGAVMALALRILGNPSKEIAEYGGRAWGLVGLTRAFPHHAGAGRIYMPAEAFDEVGLDPHDIFQGNGGPPVMAIMLATLGRAQDYADLLRTEARAMPRTARPAFSYVSLIDFYVSQIRRHSDAPFALHPEIPAFRKQWRLLTTNLLR